MSDASGCLGGNAVIIGAALVVLISAISCSGGSPTTTVSPRTTASTGSSAFVPLSSPPIPPPSGLQPITDFWQIPSDGTTSCPPASCEYDFALHGQYSTGTAATWYTYKEGKWVPLQSVDMWPGFARGVFATKPTNLIALTVVTR